MKVNQKGRFIYFSDYSQSDIQKLKQILNKSFGKNKYQTYIPMLFKDKNNYYTYFGYLDVIKMYFLDAEIIKEEIESQPLPSDDEIKHLGNITLRDYQVEVVKRVLQKHYGTVLSFMGSGKSFTMIQCIHLINQPALIIVPTQQLVQQMRNSIKQTGLYSDDDIGVLYGEEKKFNGNEKIVVGVYSTIKNYIEQYPDKMKRFKVIFLDEAQTTQQSNTGKVIDQFYTNSNAPYIIGWTGTVYRRYENLSDYSRITKEDFIMLGFTGHPIVNIPASYLIKKGYLAKPLIYVKNINAPSVNIRSWHKVYHNYIENYERRNIIIANWSNFLVHHNISTMILVNTKKHGENIFDLLDEDVKYNSVIVHGSNTGYFYNFGELRKRYIDYKDIMDRAESGEIKLILATQVFQQGTDIPSLKALIIAFGGRSYVSVFQKIGRVMRRAKNKDRCYILDFMDNTHGFLKNQSYNRLKFYRQEGLKIITDAEYFKNLIEEESNEKAKQS